MILYRGASKLVFISYSINKLQISCIIKDDKVDINDLKEKITGFKKIY